MVGGVSVRQWSFPYVAAALLAAGLASPLGVTPGTASAADAKVDLSSCLAPGAAAGDVRVFETSQGTTLTETVLDVRPRKRGWAATVEAQLAAHSPTVRETVLKPGKSMLLGDLTMGDLSIDVKKPKRWYPLKAVPGKVYNTEVKGRAYRDGARVGDALVSGAWQIVGFEPLTTQGGSWNDTAHISVVRSVAVDDQSGGVFSQESDVELWCVEGVGIVAASYAFRFYEDGQLIGEVSDLDSWLVSATVQGTAVN